MVLLFCILKDYRHVESVLLGLLEIGVTGATVIEGRGMGQIIGSEVPIFAAVRGLFPGSAVDSHLILVAADREKARQGMALVESVAGPLDNPGAGIAFTLPIHEIRGLKPEIV